MHRLFVAIRPPAPIRDQLVDAMDDSPMLRWVPDDRLHLTLRFIGEVERPLADDIAAALDRIRFHAFDIALRGTGRFDARRGGSVWAGVVPRAPVDALAAQVERACQSAGLAPDHRAFHPHVTLARYARAEASLAQDFIERTAALACPPFTVDRFILFESHLSRHGPHYESIVDYPAV